MQEFMGWRQDSKARPNGKIIDTLPNRMLVSIVDQTFDQNHKAWVFLKRGTDDEPIGLSPQG
jgi:hypothetical protein